MTVTHYSPEMLEAKDCEQWVSQDDDGYYRYACPHPNCDRARGEKHASRSMAAKKLAEHAREERKEGPRGRLSGLADATPAVRRSRRWSARLAARLTAFWGRRGRTRA